MNYLHVKDWDKFQHYKDRNPPWIKLSTQTFQNYEFSCLHDASKLLAVCIWTLASRYKEGKVPADFDWIKSQCGLSDFVQIEHLQQLVKSGYLIDASNVLSSCKQHAIPETETETETEVEIDKKTLTKVSAKKVRKKGSRLSKDWKLDGELLDWTKKEYPIDEKILFGIAQQFRDYWIAKSGKDGVKLDWDATWRNWCRNSYDIKNAVSAIKNNEKNYEGGVWDVVD